MHIGVVGLGAGTLAAYGRKGDRVRFYEINPDVIKIANDPQCFTYLTNCSAEVNTVLGDARVSMERELAEGSQQFDVLALDAFSSDAIPAHLLTQQAFRTYLAHLRDPGGILAVHVSNKVLELHPVVRAMADYYGLVSIAIWVPSDDEFTYGSDWILLSRDSGAFSAKAFQDVGRSLDDYAPLRWTDDYYSIFSVMR